MSPATVTFGELLRSSSGRTWGLAALAILVTGLAVAAMVGVSLIADPASPPMQAQIYAIPNPALSQEDIGQLYETLRADRDVAQARYRFGPPPTVAVDDAEAHFVIALRAGVDLDSTVARLESLAEVQAAVRPESSPNAARAWLAGNRALVGAGLAALTILAVVCLYTALRGARADFAGPIDLLQMAGVAPTTLRVPFVLLGALYGVAAVGALIVITLAGPLIRLDQALTSLTPTLNAPLTTFGLRSLVLGLVFGLVFGGVGWLSAPAQRYPKPLSRSRISSSSSGVSAPSPDGPSDEPSPETPSDRPSS